MMIEINAKVKTEPYDLAKDAEDLGNVILNLYDTLDGLGGDEEAEPYKIWLLENILTNPDGDRIDKDALWRCEEVAKEVAEQGREQ
jgi:hypothetical protein